jgi:DNA alkylation repair enzyme
VARSPVAEKTMRAWMRSPDEGTREMGYAILAARLKGDPTSISDTDAKAFLTTIERHIHGSPNWARYAMNTALIAIGAYKPALRKQASEAARRIGTVAADHGETYCTTPDAVAYIEKVSKRKVRQ